MNKLLLLGAFFLLVISCGENKAKVIAESFSEAQVITEKWPKKVSVNTEAMTILKDWLEFNAMETSFDALYNVENNEDLALVIEDLIEKQKLLELSEYPETFNKPHVKSRQKVFKTYFLKVKGNMEYQLDIEEPVLEMINAYNALLNQFNVIVNSALDTKLILDE